MPKKEAVEKKSYFAVLNLTTLILLITFLVIPLVFFFLKSRVITEETFGFAEIVFSILFAILSTFFLLWTKSVTMRNPYLGTLIGLILLAALEYSLFFKYKGTYTTTFALITALIVLIYLGMNFIKSLNNKKTEKEIYYEDNPTK